MVEIIDERTYNADEEEYENRLLDDLIFDLNYLMQDLDEYGMNISFSGEVDCVFYLSEVDLIKFTDHMLIIRREKNSNYIIVGKIKEISLYRWVKG